MAVAVLGADSDVYAFQPLIDVSGSVVSNISFQYTDDNNVPEQNKYIYSAYARADGVAAVAECENTLLPPGIGRTQSCAVEKLLKPPVCLLPGQCINMTLWILQHGNHAPTPTLNPCCKNSSGLWEVDYSPIECPHGFVCGYKNPRGSLTDAVANSSNYPNYKIMCSENMCNCKLQEPCVSYNSAEEHLFCTNEAPSHANQTWEFDVLSGIDYSHITNRVNENTLGVGYGSLWWSLSIEDIQNPAYTSPEGFPLRAVNVSTDNELLVLYIEPPSGDALTEYGGNIHLSLNSDQFFDGVSSLEYVSTIYYANKTFFDDLFGDEKWCVNLNSITHQMQLTKCRDVNGQFLDTLTQFYIDIVDTRIHVSGMPFMCITSTSDAYLYLTPCAPCAIGSEGHLQCEKTTDKNQWFSYNKTTETATSLRDSNSFTISQHNSRGPSSNHDFTLLYSNSEGNAMCFTTYSDKSFGYELCDPCIWESLQLRRSRTTENINRCRDAVGIQRLACTKHYSAGLYETINSRPYCDQLTVEGELYLDGNEYGIGARGVCDGTIKITKRGYGYFVYETLNMTSVDHPTDNANPENLEIHAQTQKVLIQPYTNVSFNVNTRGMEVINVSEYTEIFGKAIERNIFKAPMEGKAIFITSNILAACANIFLIILHIALIFVGDNLRRTVIAEF